MTLSNLHNLNHFTLIHPLRLYLNFLLNTGIILYMRPANDRRRYKSNGLSHWFVACTTWSPEYSCINCPSNITVAIQMLLPRYARIDQFAIRDLLKEAPLIARFMGPTWVPSGANRTQVGPMLATWNLQSGSLSWLKSCPNLFLRTSNPLSVAVYVKAWEGMKSCQTNSMYRSEYPDNSGVM